MSETILFVGRLPEGFVNFVARYGLQYSIQHARTTTEAASMLEERAYHCCFAGDVTGEPKLYFLRWATTKLPFAVFAALIEKGDTATALRAVNENHVFTLMNHDADADEIRESVQSMLIEFARRDSERALLHDMFTGSVSILLDLVEKQPLQFVNGTVISETVVDLAKTSNRRIGWEVKMAGRLCTSGLMTLSSEETIDFYNEEVKSERHRDIVMKVFEEAAGLVKRLPRLAGVAEILSHVHLADGLLSAASSPLMINCNILLASFYWNMLAFRGLKKEAIILEMKGLFSNFNEGISLAIEDLDCQLTEQLAVEVEVGDLHPGMVLAEDLLDADGNYLATRGRRLVPGLISSIQMYLADRAKFKIVAGSCPVMIDHSVVQSKWI